MPSTLVATKQAPLCQVDWGLKLVPRFSKIAGSERDYLGRFSLASTMLALPEPLKITNLGY